MLLTVLMGGSGSGKDFLINKINKKWNIPIIVSSTTRPMRKGEINHQTYHFITNEQFHKDLENNKFLEYRIYNTKYGIWYYGTSKDSVDLNINQLAILDEKGFYKAQKELGKENILGIYIIVPERIKIHRALNREKDKNNKEFFDEFYRRMSSDLYAFENIEKDKSIYKVENINADDAIIGIETILINNKIINI